MNQPISNERYDYTRPMTIGEMRMGGTPTVVVSESRVSTPVLVAGGVAALIGVAALASYLYQEKKEHDHLAMSPAAVTTPVSPEAQSGLTPPTAPTAQDSAATQPLDTLTKDKEQNTMPMAGQANNHSSDALEAPKSRTAPPAARSTARSSTAPAKNAAPKVQPDTPVIAPEPVKEPEVLNTEPPATTVPKEDKTGTSDGTPQ